MALLPMALPQSVPPTLTLGVLAVPTFFEHSFDEVYGLPKMVYYLAGGTL